MGRLSPADFLTVYGFRRPDALKASASGLRSGLSLHPSPENPELRCCPSSLYTFPAHSPGLARDCHLRFPRIWAVLHRRFPRRALKFPLSPLRMPFRHARVEVLTSFYNMAGLPDLHVPFLVWPYGRSARNSDPALYPLARYHSSYLGL